MRGAVNHVGVELDRNSDSTLVLSTSPIVSIFALTPPYLSLEPISKHLPFVVPPNKPVVLPSSL